MKIDPDLGGSLLESSLYSLENMGAELIYSDCVKNPPAKLNSLVWRGESVGFYRARLCIFEAEGRFRAETLVIYPSVGHFLPIFGSEYIELPTKSLAVIDFHPVNRNLDPINRYLASEPPRTVEKSPHYDLDGFFSPKMWQKRGGKGVYGEYREAFERYVKTYLSMLSSNTSQSVDYPSSHIPYNEYMAAHDPARGILKAYFGLEFADDYIKQFLFGKKGS